jgi:membrane protein DedA with SNARE-associated domain
MEWALAWVPRCGYAAVAGLVAASTIAPVPGESLLLVAGSLVYQGVGRLVHLEGARLEAARDWYLRWGKPSVFFGNFVPGLRHVAPSWPAPQGYPGPSSRPLATLEGLVWASSMVTLGYLFGAEWAHMSMRLHRILLGLGTAVVAVAVLAVPVRQKRRHT